MSKWIEFVKDWANKHNMKYSNALKDPKMKEAYHSMKGGKVADPFTTAYKAGFKLGRDVIAPALMKVIPPPKKGKGIKGGATKEQRANASLLRGRMKNEDTKRELNAIVHSADVPADLKDWTKKLGFRNHYVDYTNSPDVVDDPTLPNPTEILNKAFKEYFDNLDKTTPEQMFNNPHLFPADGLFVPAMFLPRWEANIRRLQAYVNSLDEEEEEETPDKEEEMDAEAFWTDPNDFRTKQWAELDYQVRVENPKPETDQETRRANILALKEFMDTEILPEVRKYNKKYGVDDGLNPKADYSKASGKFKSSKKNFIQFPLKYAGLIIQGKGMKIKQI